MLYELFFTGLIASSWTAFFFFNKLTQHGAINRTSFQKLIYRPIDKDCFILFYINGVIFFCVLWALKRVSSSSVLLAIHMLRRLVESSFYTYTYSSSMNLFHFFTGVFYYPLLLFRTSQRSAPHLWLFLLGTVAQSILHFILFAKRKSVRNLHYVVELLIHAGILMDPFNIAWIGTFTLINVLNR